MGSGKIVLLMAVVVLVGLPMVAYLWETINRLLALEFDPLRIAISIPLLAVFLGFVTFVGRRLSAWHAQQEQ